MISLFQFVKRLYQFRRWQFLLIIMLTLLTGIFSGIGIAAIIPIINLTGIYAANHDSTTRVLLAFFGIKHLSLTYALVIFIAINIITAIVTRIQTLQSNTFQQQFTTRLILDLYQKLATTTWSYWLKKTKSDVNHTINNEIMRVTVGSFYLFQLIANTSILIIYLTLSILIAYKLTILIFAVGVIIFTLLLPLVKKARKMGLLISNYSRDSFFGLNEHLHGMKEIKSYGLEKAHMNHLGTLRRQVESSYINYSILQSNLEMIYTISAAFLISGIFYVALIKDHYNLESIAFIVIILARLWPKITQIQSSIQYIVLSLPAFANITNLEQEAARESQHTKKDIVNITSFKQIEFKNINFYFAGANHLTLDNINFTINYGETIGLIGHSGSGKSTLADILLGLLSPTSGQVLVDGISLDEIKYSWQEQISYVPQDFFLFHASIRENLSWVYPSASEDEIWQALKLARLDNLIKNQPLGLETIIGDRGINFSGGERQRLVLARALLRKPKILILDEATSALDNTTEELIYQLINDLRGKITIFIIAHRTSSLTIADKIIKLDHGKIIDISVAI